MSLFMKLPPKAGPAMLFLAAVFLLLLAFPVTARADRGVIYTEPVALSEPGQKAFIVFNGTEELLVLATDVQAARETAVLEFTPFPAEPVMMLAPDGALDRLQEV